MKVFVRFFAKVIDLFIPFATSGAGYLIAESQNKNIFGIGSLVSITIFMSIFYLLYIFVSIIFTKGQTLGEVLLKIKPVSIKNNSKLILKIVLKEICYSFFVFYLFLSTSGWFPLLLLSLPIVRLKDGIYLLMPIDFLFNIKYICSAEKNDNVHHSDSYCSADN